MPTTNFLFAFLIFVKAQSIFILAGQVQRHRDILASADKICGVSSSS